MSLILEALRKSEAERRRGASPDVAMELPPTPAARTRATPAWLWPALALLALVVIAALWWSRREAMPASLPVPVQADDAPSAAPAIVARPLQQPAPPPAVVAATPIPLPSATIERAPVAAQSPVPSPTVAPPPPPSPPVPHEAVTDIGDTSMPPVKLSMHMWDASPARRFIILNGQRMAEGDRNGDLGVVAIERDGVVVERNGQRARVPLP